MVGCERSIPNRTVAFALKRTHQSEVVTPHPPPPPTNIPCVAPWSRGEVVIVRLFFVFSFFPPPPGDLRDVNTAEAL